jgi:hypothetical protein
MAIMFYLLILNLFKMKNEIQIVAYPFNCKFHTIYDSTLNFLRKNYSLVYNPSKISRLIKLKNNLFIRKTYYSIIKVMRKLRSARGNDVQINPEGKLLFCFNSLPPEEYDFILDLEIVTGMSEYSYEKMDRDYIKKRLSSDKCKAINCWNESSYHSLTSLIDCSKFRKKIHMIKFGVRPIDIKRKEREGINFLFVSSINNPQDFEGKGGLIALEVYSKLSKKYKNLKFFVRSNVPKHIKKKYSDINGIVFLDKYLTNEQMDKLFLNSDLLLEPVPGIQLMLECMQYQIPGITSDFWCIREMFINNFNGLNSDFSSLFGNKNDAEKYFKEMPSNYLKLRNPALFEPLVEDMVKNAEILIANPKIFKKMQKNQLKLIENGGDYSLRKREEKMKKLLDSIIIKFK